MASGDVTRLLEAAGGGDRSALDRLYEQVYGELRQMAASGMRRERSGHTLQPTALVNEAFLRLNPAGGAWENRRHFFGAAAQAMRRILVDHARRKNAQMRGGDAPRVSLEEAGDAFFLQDKDVTALDDALQSLERVNPRACRVVEVCFFAGMTQKEAADTLKVSVATVQRDWEFARDFLFDNLSAVTG